MFRPSAETRSCRKVAPGSCQGKSLPAGVSRSTPSPYRSPRPYGESSVRETTADRVPAGWNDNRSAWLARCQYPHSTAAIVTGGFVEGIVRCPSGRLPNPAESVHVGDIDTVPQFAQIHFERITLRRGAAKRVLRPRCVFAASLRVGRPAARTADIRPVNCRSVQHAVPDQLRSLNATEAYGSRTRRAVIRR